MFETFTPSREACLEYLGKEGILDIFDIGEAYETGVFDNVTPSEVSFPPDPVDLYRLHMLVRSRRVFNVLEFGLGYSTIVMADALSKNKYDFLQNHDRPDVRIREPFRVYAVDASKFWVERFHNIYKHLPIYDLIKLSHSECIVGEHNGQICHFYVDIPNVVTDFIYLDGPGIGDVKGSINGISFDSCIERTVMSGDLLKMESTFLPGTFVLIDGRTNNARFLQNNFKRNYQIQFDEVYDITTFELLEPPLGKINRNQIDYQLGKRYYERLNS